MRRPSDSRYSAAAAVGNGFRASELASLTPENLDLDANPPTIRVAAGYSKNRHEAVQPVPPELAELLRRFVAGKRTGNLSGPGRGGIGRRR